MTIDDVTTPLTVDECRQSIYSVLSQLGVATTTWKPGAVVRAIITAVAIVLAAFSQLTAAIAKAGWLELSSGNWLTLVAKYVYNVDRNQPTFAQGTITVLNSGTGIYHFQPGEFVVQNNTTNALYANVDAFDLPASSAIAALTIRALEAGSASSALSLSVQVIVQSLPGVAIQNDLGFFGQDEEDDGSLKIRCRDKVGALSPDGPADAYGFIARNALRPDGTLIGATRIRTVRDGAGNLDIYLATGIGTVTPDDLTIIDAAIQRQAAPLGITVRVFSADINQVDVAYELWIYNTSGQTDDQIKIAITNRLTAFFALQPIGGNVIDVGGFVFSTAIAAAIAQVTPDLAVIKCVLVTPALDVAIGPSQVPVLGNIGVVGLHQISNTAAI